MDMVGHQAIGPHVHAVTLGILREPIEIAAIVLVGFENRLIMASPLDDMVGIAGDSRAG